MNKTAIHNIATTWSRLTNEEQEKILSEFEENNATNTVHTHENQKKHSSPSPSIEAIRSLAGFVDIIAGTFAVAFQVVTSAYPIPFETGAVLIIIDGAFTISFIIKWTCYRSYSKGNLLFSGYKWQGFYTKKSKKLKLLIFKSAYKFAPVITLISYILLVGLNTVTILFPDEIILALVTIPFTAFASALEPWLYDFIALFEDGSSPDVMLPTND